MEPIHAIPAIRDSVAAVLRVWVDRPEAVKKGKTRPARIKASWAGTAFCVTTNRYLMTAFHILNGGEPRRPNDRFYAFVVPGNGNPAFHFPVVGFPVERRDIDMAVLEIGPCATPGVNIPPVTLSFAPQADGTRVLTMGYPAPEIVGFNADAQGNYLGGQFFLKSHANEGIVSAQYAIAGTQAYELNVGWHHGESGGPIVSLSDQPVVFSMMQQYRNVQAPHGVMAGPRRGLAISTVQQELANIGVVPP